VDIRSRLSALASRKDKRERLIDDIRAGKYADIAVASEYFSSEANLPPPCVAPPPLPPAPSEVSKTTFASMQSPHPLAPLRRDGKPVHSADVAFLDTETTGLAGGAGTIAFVIGVGWWESPTAFVVEQYLIRDFPEEPAALARLTERLASFKALCTYNGRTFDMPLLRTRAIMNRLSTAAWPDEHVDLLPPARRLFRGILPSVSLKAVESHALGVVRGADIDGAEIPQVFFDLARNGHAPRIPLVLSHNAQDIHSLALLFNFVADALHKPHAHARSLAERAALARWLLAIGRLDDGIRLLETTITECPRRDPQRPGWQWLLGVTLRRAQRAAESVPIWEELRRQPHRWGFTAAVELAKLHEHHFKNPADALRVLEERRRVELLNGELGALRRISSAAQEESLLALAHREARLRRKAAR